MLGLADFSLVFHDYLAAMNAARAGVRSSDAHEAEVPERDARDRRAARRRRSCSTNSAVKERHLDDLHALRAVAAGPLQAGLRDDGASTSRAGIARSQAFFGDPTFFPPIEFTASAGAMSENGF